VKPRFRGCFDDRLRSAFTTTYPHKTRQKRPQRHYCRSQDHALDRKMGALSPEQGERKRAEEAARLPCSAEALEQYL
jgi:hypothetical protein